jgi:hypothetical protein
VNKNLVVIVFVLLAAAVIGLVFMNQQGFDREKEAPKAPKIRDTSIEEVGKVSSYAYSSTVETDSNGLLDDSPINVKTLMEGNGTIDLKKKLMHTIVNIAVGGSSGGNPIKTNSQTEMYVVGGSLYSKAGILWVKQPLGEDAWSKTQLDALKEAVRNANVSLAGIEMVNGKPAYLLEFRPDMDALMGYSVEIRGNTPLPRGGRETIGEYSIREWISTESLLPLKTESRLLILSGNVTTNMKVVTGYHDYNKQFELNLPEEAANATEM